MIPPEFVQDVFDLQRVRHDYKVAWFGALQLARWPVVAVASVIQASALGVTQTLVQGVDFQLDAATGRLIRRSADTGLVKPWEPLPVTVDYVAGYGSAIQETHAVPAGAPYTVTVSQAALFSCDQSVTYANGTALVSTPGAPAAGQYALSPSTGVYTFNAADAGSSLTFAYGVRATPPDLEEACLRLITGRYHAAGRDPSLVQRDTPNVGLERWWFGGAPGQSGAFPPDIEALLSNYHVPVMA